MNFATGLTCGMGAGVAAGMTSGIARGKKQARGEIEGNLRQFLLNHDVTIRDGEGRTVSFDQFLDQTVAIEGGDTPKRKRTLMALLAVGTALLVSIILVFVILSSR